MKGQANSGKEHTAPWECTFTKEEEGICNPGKIPKSDEEYFEILSLCVLQAGLGWGSVRKNWRKTKAAFLNFDIDRLADSEVDEHLKNPGMIRNRKKTESIIANAREFQKIKKEYSSFSNYLNTLKKGDYDTAIDEITNRFRHIGKYSAEYFLHSIGY
ncbi:MAG: DNA-3-methyladenine glycosylase I [Methanomassiliicoccales archaeon]|nr:MAG: DNA-3-methyladenine glycosylase I [Methanomassiliicoccales archaeon]